MNWQEFLSADQEAKVRWVQDLRRAQRGTHIATVSTRINAPGSHLLIRQGQRASAVVSYDIEPDYGPVPVLEERRKLLSVSYDALADWHLILRHDSMAVLNNRLAKNAVLVDDLAHDCLPPTCLGDRLGVDRDFQVVADYHDVSDRMFDRLDLLKRQLVGDPGAPRVSDSLALDAVLNCVLLLRFLEDVELARGSSRFTIVDCISDSPRIDLAQLLSRAVAKLELSPAEVHSITHPRDLENIPPYCTQAALDWLLSSYRDDEQGRYEFDFSIIGDQAIGQIYDKYISAVAFHTNNGRTSLFPEYETELHWQKGTGSIYTPEFLARFMVGFALRNFSGRDLTTLRVGDLACGSGVFIRNFLATFSSHQLTSPEMRRTLSNLVAVDKNSSAIAATRLSIGMAAYHLSDILDGAFAPQHADTLSLNPAEIAPGSLDLILMNPPFKGYLQQTIEERSAVQATLGDLAKGRVDYSAAFVKMGFDLLLNGGCMCMILPAAFTDSDYAAPIRKLLAENGQIQLVAKFEDNALFSRGQIQIAIVCFRKSVGQRSASTAKILYCRTSPDLALRAIELSELSSGFEREVFEADTSSWSSNWPLLSTRVRDVLDYLSRSNPSLSSLFHIRQGIRPGLKCAFILRDYHTIPRDERDILLPVADDQNISSCRLHRDDRRLIYAYRAGAPLDETEMHDRYSHILDHLRRFEDRLQSRRTATNRPMWTLIRPRDPDLMFSPKLVCTNFGLQGSYALDQSGSYAVTNGSFLVPKVQFDDPQDWFYFLAALNSSVFIRILGRRSRKLKGGYFDFDQRFTKGIPVPNPALLDADVRGALQSIGQRLHSDGLIAVDTSEFDSWIIKAYGLSHAQVEVL